MIFPTGANAVRNQHWREFEPTDFLKESGMDADGNSIPWDHADSLKLVNIYFSAVFHITFWKGFLTFVPYRALANLGSLEFQPWELQLNDPLGAITDWSSVTIIASFILR